MDPSVPDDSFPLPALTLKRSGAVLDEAIASIRNDRAARHGQPGRIFTSAEMVSALQDQSSLAVNSDASGRWQCLMRAIFYSRSKNSREQEVILDSFRMLHSCYFPFALTDNGL